MNRTTWGLDDNGLWVTVNDNGRRSAPFLMTYDAMRYYWRQVRGVSVMRYW